MSAFVYPAPGTTVYPPAASSSGGDLLADGSVPMDNAATLSWRNAADSADVPALKLSATDVLTLGDSATFLNYIGIVQGASSQVDIYSDAGNVYLTSFKALTAIDEGMQFYGDGLGLYGSNAAMQLRFWDGDIANWIALQAPQTAGADITFTLPSSDGSAGQVLSTDGSGIMSWANVATGNAGAVQFSNGSGVITADSTNLVWDDANNRLGIGVAAPFARLHIATGTDRNIVFSTGGANPNAAVLSVVNDANTLNKELEIRSSTVELIGQVVSGAGDPVSAQDLVTKAYLQKSGTTANRPGSPAVGQFYMDTDLTVGGSAAVPIWWDGSNWIRADGTSV